MAVLGLHCCAGFSLVVESGGYSLVVVLGFLIAVISLVLGHGFPSPWRQQLQFLGSRAQAQQFWHTDLVTLCHVGSSPIRD